VLEIPGYVQEISIKGTVKDENGDTLPGVSVLIKGTKNGTVTDGNGNFSIDVPSTTSVLVFSFTGMNTKEVLVGTQTTLSVQLMTNVEALGEVVVIGYGTMRKSDL